MKTATNPLLLKEKLLQLKKTKISTHSDASCSSKEELYSQDLIGIRDIYNGICFLENGSIVNILEIIPLNYSEKPAHEKDRMASLFGYSFKQFPKNGQIKIMSSKADIEPFIRNIRKAMKNETDPKLLERVEDYIAHTRQLQRSNSVRKRFFFIYEYSGDEKGKRSDNLEDIWDSLMQEQVAIINAFRGIGNIVIPMAGNMDLVSDILYKYLNPKSYNSEDFESRVEHVQAARQYYADKKEDVIPPISDYFASRGVKFGKWNYAIEDGIYTTYMVLKDTSIPTSCTVGWLDNITSKIPNGDVDIFYKQSSLSFNSYVIDRVNVISGGLSMANFGNQDKNEELRSTSDNAKYLKDLIDKNEEDLYEVCIIITLRANSYKELVTQKAGFLKEMRTLHFYFEDCFMKTQLFYKSTLPFAYVEPSIFKSNRRNMTNSSLSTLYCFTSCEMFDPNGLAMGITHKDSTLYAFDNFDSDIFPNPHIFIAGTTGAGKTFTELMLTSRMRMKGIKTYFVLPLKGHEYRDAILSLGGYFYSLRPGSKICINICAIRPEGKINKAKLDSDDYEHYDDVSLLSKKISSLVTWLKILMGDDKMTVGEAGDLNLCLSRMYNRFGITDDNDSIWADASHTKLKKMPILEDVYNEIKEAHVIPRVLDVLKPWVYGSCRNMNGQTNVDFDNDTIAMDINEDIIGEELLPGFMYICFDLFYDLIKENPLEYNVMALDEMWQIFKIPSCASQIFKAIKILRGYGGSVVSATQEIRDCLSNEYGRSILSLSAIKIFLKMTETELNDVTSVVHMSEENKKLLLTMPKGYGFIISNNESVLVKFDASELEEELYTTDVKVKRRLYERRLWQTRHALG